MAMPHKKDEPNKKFIMCSDSPDWCKDNLENMGLPTTTIINRCGVKEDFATLVSCDSAIIANSTFSWWGAWLCNGRVITPDPFAKWFGPAYAHYDMKDLIPHKWTSLGDFE